PSWSATSLSLSEHTREGERPPLLQEPLPPREVVLPAVPRRWTGLPLTELARRRTRLPVAELPGWVDADEARRHVLLELLDVPLKLLHGSLSFLVTRLQRADT